MRPILLLATLAIGAPEPDTLERPAAMGVKLVGIDTASIDPADSNELASHQVIRRLGFRMLADASPVRAVLRPL